MQDIHTLGCGGIGGAGGGRIFAASGVDRRLQHQNHQQALKCPRCDSQNTKFCYYNNYNLSQPRHYCKTCRRYWTKGGVLRNVPVGGGCRKSKRSSKTRSSKIVIDNDENKIEASGKNSHSTQNNNSLSSENNNSHSSSESSSLTATTTTVATKSNTDCGGTTAGNSHNTLFLGEHHADNDSCGHDHYCQPLIEQHKGPSNGHMLPITDIMSSPEPEKMMMGSICNGGSGIDGGGGEDGLFDVSCEDGAYWNQAQWVDDNDQAFKFLPQFQVLDFNLEKK